MNKAGKALMWVQFLPGALTFQKSVKRVRIMAETSDYMTVQEAAEFLDVHPVTVRRLLKLGQLQYIKVGYATMVLKESVKAYKAKTKGMNKRDPRRNL